MDKIIIFEIFTWIITDQHRILTVYDAPPETDAFIYLPNYNSDIAENGMIATTLNGDRVERWLT
uniref:Uncharacterized protein n=1 Tax=viral metagenome TaxID=1070528 RepID=A0A6M3LRC7_9ZZZZ